MRRRIDRDAAERDYRGGNRALLLPAGRSGAEPHRLRARELPVGRYLYQAQPDLEVIVCEDDEEIVERIDERTLLVPISHVLFKESEIQDVDAIVRRSHEVGAHVILDCYQSAGIVPVDVTALGVDFAVGGSVKWLCGGPANGWLYVRPERAERLEPTSAGWQAHERPFAFEEEMEYASGAARFLTGTPNPASHMAGTAGYDLIEEIGIERIRANSLRQTQLLADLADAAGFDVRSPREPARRGGTVTIDVPEGAAVYAELESRGVLGDFRPGAGIRLGPHFFTTDDELRFAVGQIVALVESGAYAPHLGAGRAPLAVLVASGREREALDVDRVVGENLGTLVGDDDRVGVPKAADGGVVEAGFDREDHAGLERGMVADIEERRLVVAEPDAVAGVLAPIAEQVVLLEVPHDGAVDVCAGRAGSDRVDRDLLGCNGVVEEPPHLVRRLADDQRPLELGVVAPDRCARLGHEYVTGAKLDVVRDRVRPRAAQADLAAVACGHAVGGGQPAAVRVAELLQHCERRLLAGAEARLGFGGPGREYSCSSRWA